MDLPPFVKLPELDIYHEELNQTLRDGLSNNGWTVPQLTTAQIAAIAPSMPDGTIWYCTDHVAPVYVGLISGALVQFTTAAFP